MREINGKALETGRGATGWKKTGGKMTQREEMKCNTQHMRVMLPNNMQKQNHDRIIIIFASSLTIVALHSSDLNP